MSLSERLELAMRHSGVSQADLARACNVKPPSVHGWLSGKARFLRGENLLSAARALGVRSEWLATGIGPMLSDATEPDPVDLETHPDLSPVRRVRLRLKAGISGFAVEMAEGKGPPIFFRRDWLKERGLFAHNLIALKVSGPARSPGLLVCGLFCGRVGECSKNLSYSY